MTVAGPEFDFAPMDWEDMVRETETQAHFIIDGVISSTSTLIYGEAKVGKSFLVSALIASLALGRDFLGPRVFEDKASGKNTARAGLMAALDYTREGDTLVVWKLDRLGRSTKDVLTIAEDLHARGVALRILTGTLAGSYSPKGEGNFFFTMMVAFAELERDMIVERTRAGLEAAKAQGRTGGRPKAMTEDMIAAAKARRAAGEPYGAIAKALGVGQATVYRHLSE